MLVRGRDEHWSYDVSNLGEALRQIKEALLDGEAAQAALREAAMEFGFNPALLARKWEEQHKCSPEQWLAQEHARLGALESLQRGAVIVAQARARSEAAKWRMPEEMKALAGRLFTLGRQRYAFVVKASDNPAWAIRAIRVEDERVVNFPLERWSEIEPQLQVLVRERKRVQPVAQTA